MSGLPHAERVERARVGVIEAVPVLARVEERERPAGRGRGQVDAQHVGERHGEHVAPRRVAAAWFSFSSSFVVNGSVAQIGERADRPPA